jgi:PAS domain-containing protein
MSGDTDAATSPLQALFEELETLYRTAPIGIGLVDRELKFVRVNLRVSKFAATLRYSRPSTPSPANSNTI